MPTKASADASANRDDPQVVLELSHATLWFYPQSKIVHHELRRFMHGEELRSFLSAGMDVFERRGAHKWLSDDRGNGPLKPEDEAWARKHWAPRALRAGFKYWAVVMPEKIFGQTNLQRIVDAYASVGVTTQVFEKNTAALEWLREK